MGNGGDEGIDYVVDIGVHPRHDIAAVKGLRRFPLGMEQGGEVTVKQGVLQTGLQKHRPSGKERPADNGEQETASEQEQGRE